MTLAVIMRWARSSCAGRAHPVRSIVVMTLAVIMGRRGGHHGTRIVPRDDPRGHHVIRYV